MRKMFCFSSAVLLHLNFGCQKTILLGVFLTRVTVKKSIVKTAEIGLYKLTRDLEIK